jgi:hypothetical protein
VASIVLLTFSQNGIRNLFETEQKIFI